MFGQHSGGGAHVGGRFTQAEMSRAHFERCTSKRVGAGAAMECWLLRG